MAYVDKNVHDAKVLEAGSGLAKLFSAKWWLNAVLALGCVLMAAMAAGLTMGLNGFDEEDLARIMKILPEDLKYEIPAESLESEIDNLKRQQRHAKTIYSVVAGHWLGNSCNKKLNPTNHHYVLVTLLLLNSCANEAMPMFLKSLVPEWAAVIFSISLVLCFGEIFPSAIFTGQHQLPIAAFFTPFVKFVEVVLFPLVLPISLGLDKLLGHGQEMCRYQKARIKCQVRMQLEDDEVKMIEGALELAHKTVDHIGVMTKLSDVHMLEINEELDQRRVQELMVVGHSRIPVYDRVYNNIRGFVLVKDILKRLTSLGGNFNEMGCVADHPEVIRRVHVMAPNTNLLDAINVFQTGRHLALVCGDPNAAVASWSNNAPLPESCQIQGIVTLEEVIEELLQEDIKDEVDIEVEERIQKNRKWMALNFNAARGRVTTNSRDNAEKLLRCRTVGDSDLEEPLIGDLQIYRNSMPSFGSIRDAS
uniref:CNNM transmembrane domain-containing protein n=1 Tax=Noctiluca scintillans TaxID=2966 RepID=A0A7S1AHI2_NOCSC